MLTSQLSRSQTPDFGSPSTTLISTCTKQCNRNLGIGFRLALTVIIDRVSITVFIGKSNLQTVTRQRQNIQLTTLYRHPSIGTKYIDINVNHFVRLINGIFTGFISSYTVISQTMDIDSSVFEKLHVTIINSISITNPAILSTHFPMNFFSDIGLSVRYYSPVVRFAPLRERTFEYMLFTILTIVNIPFTIKQRAVERNILGGRNGTNSQSLINRSGSTSSKSTIEVIAHGKLSIRNIDGTGKIAAFHTNTGSSALCARTCGRHKDRVSVRTGELIAGNTFHFHPLSGTECKEFFKLSNGRHGHFTFKCFIGKVISCFVDIGRSITCRIDTGIKTCLITETEQTTNFRF